MNYENEQQPAALHHRHWPILRSNDRLNDRIYFSHTIWRERRIYPLRRCLDFAAVLLPRPYALAAAAIGGGLADLMTAPMWAPATILIKMLITLPFTSHSTKMLEMRNIIAPLPALFLSATGYYLAEGILFGSFAAPLASLAGSAIQSGGSAVIFSSYFRSSAWIGSI